MHAWLINIAYLVASILFVFCLKGLTHPRTAVRGNLYGAIGMFIAVIVTLLDRRIVSFEIILAGVVLGSAIGAILAIKIRMTAMPQLVALFNGFGGGASVLVAGAALIESGFIKSQLMTQLTVATVASGIIGSVTFWGSLVAFSKLQNLLFVRPTHFKGQHILNAVLFLGSIGFGVLVVTNPSFTNSYWFLVGLSSILGVLIVIPIGGADMPVVIAFLNSLSGLAACATGFVLLNNVLIIAGSLVGASGLILR